MIIKDLQNHEKIALRKLFKQSKIEYEEKNGEFNVKEKRNIMNWLKTGIMEMDNYILCCKELHYGNKAISEVLNATSEPEITRIMMKHRLAS